MLSLFKNTTAIDGNGNIIIQDAKDSTITINSANTTELNILASKLEKIEELIGEDPIYILILTSPLEEIQSLTDSQKLAEKLKNPINNYYEEKSLEEWKPFGDKSIIQIIQEVAPSLRTGFLINQLSNFSDSLDIEIQALFRYIRKDSILIVDSLSLLNSGNMEIAEMFDDYHVGGCIIVDSCCLDSDEEMLLEARQKMTKFLNIYLRNGRFAGKIENDHIKIEDVNEEHKLRNALYNLAIRLGAKTKMQILGVNPVRKLY